MIKKISPEELQSILENNGAALIIDVRSYEEHAREYIDGSYLIPLQEICLTKLPKKTGTIVLHCAVGIRSDIACTKLEAEDPSIKVYSLTGGLKAWKLSGGKTKTQ